MNNAINVLRKIKRDNLERGVVSAINKHIPNVEQYIASHRYPALPKIVVYSAASQANSFLEKYKSYLRYRLFPFYNLVTPSVGS